MTLIPKEYANNKISNFTIKRFSKKKGAKSKAAKEIKYDFFLMWIPLKKSEKELNESIAEFFPSIPISKIYTCEIDLVYPVNYIKSQTDKNLETDKNNFLIKSTIGKMIPIALSDKILSNIPIIRNAQEHSRLKTKMKYSGSVYFWSFAFKLVLQIISEGNFYPYGKHGEEDFANYQVSSEQEGIIKLKWRPVLRSQKDFINYEKILDFAPIAAYAITNEDNQELIQISSLLSLYLNEMTDLLIRHSAQAIKYAKFSEVYGFSPKDIKKLGERIPWEVRLLGSLLLDDNDMLIYTIPEKAIPDMISKWTQFINRSYWKEGYSLALDLHIPNNVQQSWKIDFILQSFGSKEQISLSEFWARLKQNPISSEIELRRNLLVSLYNLSLIFPPIKKSLDEMEPKHISLSKSEASEFLEYTVS
ncbi:MAG: hypothetical protein GF364_08500, partial [Candidatus Lokiarchaeota archaeon]|nr:hypothetical protein [Candidatus Lokiarchaeota archaeon]